VIGVIDGFGVRVTTGSQTIWQNPFCFELWPEADCPRICYRETKPFGELTQTLAPEPRTGRRNPRPSPDGFVHPAKHIGSMLVGFLATDRAFAKLGYAEPILQAALHTKSRSEQTT